MMMNRLLGLSGMQAVQERDGLFDTRRSIQRHFVVFLLEAVLVVEIRVDVVLVCVVVVEEMKILLGGVLVVAKQPHEFLLNVLASRLELPRGASIVKRAF